MSQKLPDYIIKNFNEGVITRVEDESLPKGAAGVGTYNWLGLGDHIELRRGQAVLGTAVNGAGRVTGLRVARKLDAETGTQVMMSSYGRKVRWYDESTDDWDEVNVDQLPAAASGEDVAIEKYYSLAGAFFYLSSPNSGVYKIPVANPDSLVDLQITDYRGRIKAKSNGFYLFNRKDTNGGSDRTGLYRSWLDKVELSAYPFTEKEQSATAGNGVITALSGTLAAIDKATAANVKRTAHYVRIGVPQGAAKVITAITKATQAVVSSAAHGLAVGQFVVFEGITGMVEMNGKIGLIVAVPTAGSFTVNINSTAYTNYTAAGTASVAEVFVDQRDGTLTGNTTGTGTINYATGAYVVNAPGIVTNTLHGYAEYYYEDSTDADSGSANSGAPFDFSYDIPRTAGQGLQLRQDAGGYLFQNVFNLYGDDYCFHSDTSFKLTVSADDETEISNQQFLVKMGIPYWRAGFETSDGVVYVDGTDPNDVQIRRLQILDTATRAKPTTISQKLDLAPYRFNFAVVFEWGSYYVIACRTKDSAINDTVLLYHKIWKSWDIVDYRVSCIESYNGGLIAGDSGSNNVFSLFDGLADEESDIPNSWVSGEDTLGVEGQKKAHRALLAGNIGIDQEIDFMLAPDNGPFVTAFTIKGNGPYVDKGHPIQIGPNVLGSEMLGGGGDGIEAFHYRHEFTIHTERFEKMRYKFVAKKLGYASVSEIQFKDMRYKGRRAAFKYVSEPGTDGATDTEGDDE